jgi:hypothetical protein
MMRGIRGLLGFCLMGFAVEQVAAQLPAPPAQSAPASKPRVYALLVAIGEQFTTVTEVFRTGTHISPYVRRTSQTDVLNRLALHSLDEAVARADPTSTRIYMALPAPAVDRVAPSEREATAIAEIKQALEGMPQRSQWDRIVVVTPAYRALEANGLGSKLQGFGIFEESQCQAGCGGFDKMSDLKSIAREPPDGAAAFTSEDKPIKARTFIAPYSYIAVWILDPKTLEILDRQESLDSQKLAEPPDKPLNMSQADVQKYLAMRVANVIDVSITDAVMHSEVNLRRGIVETGPVKVVQPDSETKPGGPEK